MAEDIGKPSLLDLARASILAKGPRCTVASTIEGNPDRAGEITELIAATPNDIPYQTAAATMQAAGIHLKADTISRHRRGECACK